jgi:hypothetical protein
MGGERREKREERREGERKGGREGESGERVILPECGRIVVGFATVHQSPPHSQ